MSINKDWLDFEYYSIKKHIQQYGHQVWHTTVIPEDELYNAGVIHNFNKTRLDRLARKRAALWQNGLRQVFKKTRIRVLKDIQIEILNNTQGWTW